MRYALKGRYAPPEIRFWRKVRFMPNGCWEWQGALTKTGYAELHVGGTPRRAHRWVFERTFGSIEPQSLVVMHTCDNKKCVRVAHLRLGTKRDNALDASAKGLLGKRRKEKMAARVAA